MPELYYQDFDGQPEATPVVVLHGLFGSAGNWRGVARRLSGDRRVLAMDMRNHGRSLHDEAMTYPVMAADVLDTLDAAGIERAVLMGHSMGGKAAMVAALQAPERVEKLVVVDIAPVVYTHSHAELVDAMRRLDVAALGSRAEADQRLAGGVEDDATRQFLLQSLEKADTGYRWRLNLDALERAMPDLVGFPGDIGGAFEGPTLFLYGQKSKYVQPEHRPRIEALFPGAEYAAIENAGHWVHAEQPAALVERLTDFLRR